MSSMQKALGLWGNPRTLEAEVGKIPFTKVGEIYVILNLGGQTTFDRKTNKQKQQKNISYSDTFL